MKILTVSLMIAAVALGLTGSAHAQAAGPKKGGAGVTAGAGKQGRAQMQKMTDEILAKLKLTDDQKAKFKAHQEEMKKKTEELRGKAKGGATDEVKEKLKELQKENQKFMKDTLTKEQFAEFQKLRREKMKEMRSKSGAPAQP